jgi:small basic protein
MLTVLSMLRILLTVLRTVRYLVVHISYASAKYCLCYSDCTSYCTLSLQYTFRKLCSVHHVLYLAPTVHISNIVLCASCTVPSSYSTYLSNIVFCASCTVLSSYSTYLLNIVFCASCTVPSSYSTYFSNIVLHTVYTVPQYQLYFCTANLQHILYPIFTVYTVLVLRYLCSFL